MSVTHLFAGIAVSDFAAARRWYEALFGRPPDMLPMEGEAVWHATAPRQLTVTDDDGNCIKFFEDPIQPTE
jgi:hypothetical protein